MNQAHFSETAIGINALINREVRNFSVEKRCILIIEDDYVNYLFAKTFLDVYGVKTLRFTSFEEALLFDKGMLNVDLIIANYSLIELIDSRAVKYIKEEHEAPLMAIDSDLDTSDSRGQAINESVDCVVSIFSDEEHFYDAISELYQK